MAYQLLAYRHRLDRQFDKAQDAIQKAIDRAPMIPAHYVAAWHITFGEAVPEHLDEIPRTISPVAFHPIFYRPTDRQARLLDKAVEFYKQAILLLSGIRLALGLLAEDPADFSALFYCLEWDVPFDADRSIHALETKRLEGEVR